MNYPLALKNGTILADDYRIEGILGAGGSGITYVAKEISLNRDIAIKEYFPSDFAMREGETQVCAKTTSDEEDYVWGLDRFIEEAQTLAKFDHSNIVRVFRYFQTHNTAYMVLKFEEGQNFKTWLEELDRPPSQAELDVIITPLLDALELIHKDNFLHRDIAPDNIIIRRNGSPVLIDFGSARRVITSRPKTVSALIKPGYSPFEQYAMTGKDQGPWTDIYSLAATLYHAVTGKRPLDSPTRMVSDELVSAVKAAKPGYRKSFLQAIDAALKLKTRNRPQTIEEWRDKLFSVTASPVRKSKKAASSTEKTASQKATKSKTEPAEETAEQETEALAPTKKITTEPPKKPVKKRARARKAKETPQPEASQDQPPMPFHPAPPVRGMEQGKLSLLQKVSRQARRSVIRFLAEHARNDLNEKRDDDEGGLVTRLSNLNPFPENHKSLEEQMRDRQDNTRSPYAGEAPLKTSKKKNNIIKKILSMPTEAEQAEQQKNKPAAVPNKSFDPIGPTQKPLEEESKKAAQENLVTVKLNRKKIEVVPGPTTEARARLVEKRKQEKTQKPKRRISRLSIALRTMQLLLVFAIVTPFIYFMNLENESITTGSTSTGGIARILRGHLSPVTALAFSENGNILVSAGHDNNIRIWDSNSGKQTGILRAHKSDVTALDISNNRVLSSDTEGEMILWDLQNGKALKNFKGHKSAIATVHFDNKAKRIISATTDNELKIWNSANTRKEQLLIRPHKKQLKDLAYSSSRRLLATIGDENVIRLWNLKTGRLRATYYVSRREKPQAVALSKSGQRLAVTGPGFLRVWSTGRKRILRSIRLDKKDITTLAFSPDGKLLAVANADRTINVWNWRQRKIVRTLSGHGGKIYNLAFSPDGMKIASASQDYTVRLWALPGRSSTRQ